MDRDLGASPSKVGFAVDPAESLLRPRTHSSQAEASWRLALVGAFVIHATVLSLLVVENELTPAIAPAALEIPIEIVPEPPPQKSEAPAAKTEPAPRQIDEEPAYDAPRAANNEKIEREAADAATHAPNGPQAAAPSLSPAPGETAATAADREIGAAHELPEPAADKPADAETPTLAANGETPPQEQARVEAKTQAEKLPTFVGEPFPTWSTGVQISAAESLPDIELGGAAGPSPVSGGKARTTYLSILYGMIMSHLHLPAAGASSQKTEGVIVFTVDGTGTLVQRQIARASGSPDLDSAALGAVGEAAPFPKPPQGLPMRLRFTYNAK